MSQWANEKLCNACGLTKPLAEFSPRTDGKSGVKSHCTACLREQARAWSTRNREKVRQQARARYVANAEAIKARSAAYKRANREKSRAHSAVEWALKTGKLTRPDTCNRCQAGGRIEAHHADYTRKLDVEWLCSPCHGLEHSAHTQEAVA